MIVGTAGHIDHGKTSLVKALTGVDADRLSEEQHRGISIDLGFAYLDRPDGSRMSFVDVPGHERFMRNMLAGATGVDFLMLVVAADDGVMPQTREHLAVIELLGLARGMVAITKCDLVDEARLDHVIGQVRELLSRGRLADVDIFPVSTHTGDGLENILAALDLAAQSAGPVRANGRFRFAIDRSFSLQGAGTVATGVVWSGQIETGDIVTISPAGMQARVRSLHVENRPAERAMRGQRCGINLGKVGADAIHRGDFLIEPWLHQPTARIDAELSILPDEPRPLRHWTPVRVHHGAAEIAGRLALLQDDPIAPGTDGRAQIVLDRPISAAVGDRFIIRDTSGARTIGGGRLLDLRPPQRRRKQPRRIEQLDAMAAADPAQSLFRQLTRWPWQVDRDNFARDRALDALTVEEIFQSLPLQQAEADGVNYLFADEIWIKLCCSAKGEVSLFHKRYPQLLGPNLQRLLGAFGPRIAPGPAKAVLEELVRRKRFAREAGVYRLPEHKLGLDRGDDEMWNKVAPLLGGEARYRPPRVGQLAENLKLRDFDLRRVLKAMSKQGKVVEIATDHFFLRETLGEVATIVFEIAQVAQDGCFAAALLRDRLDNGRKVSIQILEYFDRQGLTLRRGDLRVIDPRRLQRFQEATLQAA